MLKKVILNIVNSAIVSAVKENKLGQMTTESEYNLVVETPKNYEFGDFAVNVSQLARHARLAPPQIAEIIKNYINMPDIEINVIAGFINFKLGNSYITDIISEIINNKNEYGKLNKNSQKVLLEYVSANPTGPFHIGHGRWAAMGSALANLLKYAGYDVFQEFYINDAGSQIDNMARSVYLRILQQKGINIDFPTDENEIKKYYPGEYLIPLAKDFIGEHPNFTTVANSYEELDIQAQSELKEYSKAYMLNLQKKLLSKLNVQFDKFFSETSLYKDGLVESTIERMQKNNLTYKEDGALWFKTTDFGDEKDRVLIKQDGKYTYLSPDIAYHINKLERGFNKLINIWGADHHGYVLRMKAALQGLGYDADALEVLLGQLVNLKIDGEAVRMGKRKKMITLEELVDEVGTDSTRYWMIFRNIDTTLDFDVELAKSKSDENPVFYVQYAHARACSILRNATTEKVDTVNNEIKKSLLTEDELNEYISKCSTNSLAELYNADNTIIDAVKRLIFKLEEFKYLIESSASARAPYLICKYLQELSAQFHQFYSVTRVITESKEQTLARLAVVVAFKTVLSLGLTILGISSPERM